MKATSSSGEVGEVVTLPPRDSAEAGDSWGRWALGKLGGVQLLLRPGGP